MKKKSGGTWKLGLFVTAGLILFVFTIYYVGKQKNLFGSTFHLRSQFKTVSGLKVGNNVRLSGINIGTVDDIELITDTSVMVNLVIRKKYQQFIKKDALCSIGSDGLMGDKVFTIVPGATANGLVAAIVKDNDMIHSKNAIEMEDVMLRVKSSVDNAAIITEQLAQFSSKMNNGNGALSKLISDKEFSNSIQHTLTNLESSSKSFASFTDKINNGNLTEALDSTMANIQGATKGLNENMEAAKHNFLLRGYFKKKKKADDKKAADLKKAEELKKKNDLKKAAEDMKTVTSKTPVQNAVDSARH